MKELVLNESLARRFLLGQLPLEEQGRIEELAFQDPETFAFLQSAEDDLVDEFLHDELSQDEKERFEKHFLTRPGRRQNLRIARALKQYFAEDDPVVVPATGPPIIPQPKPTFFQLFLEAMKSPLVVTVIVIAVGAGLLVPIIRRRGDGPSHVEIQPSPVATPSTSASPIPSATPESQPDNQNKRTPSSRQSTEPAYAIVLVPGTSVRSEGEVRTLQRPANPIKVELPVISKTPYRSYRAELQTDGKIINTWPNLKPRQLTSGRAIQITILPSQLAGSQRFRITLNGVSANGQTQLVHNYDFQLSE